MAAEKKGKLTARGAPIMASPYLKHPELSDSDRIDSGFVDSFKSDESKSESMTMIQEITEKMSINDTTAEFVCDDASTNTRHPQPCSPPKPTSNSPKETAPCMSPVDSMLSFAQSNDVRHLLAPYRHHLLVQNEDGDTPIHLAVIHCHPHIDALISIVPKKECLNIYNFLRQTPLHLAAITRQSSVVSFLLQAGAGIDLVDRKGKTALHLACEGGDMNTVTVLTQFLINTFGIDSWEVYTMLSAHDYQGFSALQLAVKNNHLDTISHLVSLGANVDQSDGTSGRTALHLAVEDNNLKMVNFLLHNCGASVNAKRYDENTPLHIAAGRGLVPMTARLLAAGGDLSIANSDDETPLDHATPEVLSVLKELL